MNRKIEEIRQKLVFGAIALLVIAIVVVVYFCWLRPAQAIANIDGGTCWTYPSIQDEYVGPSLSVGEAANRERTNIRDSCGNNYSVIILPDDESLCCRAGTPVIPLIGWWGTKTILWWCAGNGLQYGPINGQLIFFDTDAYVGFWPDPTCYEP